MKVLCLLMFLYGAIASDTETQTISNIAMKKDDYSVVLRGEVKSIQVKNTGSSEVMLTIDLKMELLNNGAKSVIFLETKPPELRGAALIKNPVAFSASKRLVLDYKGESIDTSPEWTVLRNALNQSSPPPDKIRVLTPNESWKWEDAVDIALPQSSNKNYFSDKRESWESLEQLQTVWLQTICQVWSLNLEAKNSEQTELIFGNELQTRWKDVGLLWLDNIQSEAIALDLRTAVINRSRNADSSASFTPASDSSGGQKQTNQKIVDNTRSTQINEETANKEPVEIVRKYWQLSEKGDLKEASKLTTNKCKNFGFEVKSSLKRKEREEIIYNSGDSLEAVEQIKIIDDNKWQVGVKIKRKSGEDYYLLHTIIKDGDEWKIFRTNR